MDKEKQIDKQEYLSERKKKFVSTYGDSENTWRDLESQIESAYELGISYGDISKYIDMPLNYQQREVIKYGLWSGTKKETLDLFKSDIPYREMMAKIYSDSVDEKITDMVDKPFDSMEQMMSSVLETLNLLKSETDAKSKEQEKVIEVQRANIENLKSQLAESEGKIEKIMSATDENSRVNILELRIKDMEESHSKEISKINEENELRRMRDEIDSMRRDAENEIHLMTEELEKKKYMLDQEIDGKAEQLAEKKFAEMKKKFEEEQKLIENIRIEERLRAESGLQSRKKHSARRRKKALKEVTGSSCDSAGSEIRGNVATTPAIDFNNIRELPENFDIGSYMMHTDLPSDIYDIICVGVKCGCPDYILKQMIDSGLPGEKLKPLMEIYLAKRARESKSAMVENADDEADIKYM
jgi:hypothetical protein